MKRAFQSCQPAQTGLHMGCPHKLQNFALDNDPIIGVIGTTLVIADERGPPDTGRNGRVNVIPLTHARIITAILTGSSYTRNYNGCVTYAIPIFKPKLEKNRKK